MTTTWEKRAGSVPANAPTRRGGERLKFLIGGLVILGAVAYLIISGTLSGARYFISVNELLSKPDYAGQTVRITGAVLGDSITYDTETLTIEFTVANIEEPYTDLAQALYEAVNNPQAERVHVRVENTVMPDLLKNEAQAILTGTLDANGVFQATELNLKCPSRFIEEGGPSSADLQQAGA
jgi:cytochrome c-type biogenesis protein CcmE